MKPCKHRGPFTGSVQTCSCSGGRKPSPIYFCTKKFVYCATRNKNKQSDPPFQSCRSCMLLEDGYEPKAKK